MEKFKNYLIAGLCLIILGMIIYVSSCNKAEDPAPVYLPARDTALESYVKNVLVPKLDSVQEQGKSIENTIKDKQFGLKVLEQKYIIKSNEIKTYSNGQLNNYIISWLDSNRTKR